MDINDKIAARRAELSRQAQASEQAEKVRREAEETRRRADEAMQKRVAEIALVKEINAGDEAEAVRKDGEVELVHHPVGFTEGMRLRTLVRLYRREARRLWTPLDQWVIISLIAGGICTIHLAGFGLLLVVAGFVRRHYVNRRCRTQLREAYPDLFGELPAR